MPPHDAPARCRSCTSLRTWWDTIAGGDEQAIVLAHAGVSIGLAGLPWAFLPPEVQAALTRQFAYQPAEKRGTRAG